MRDWIIGLYKKSIYAIVKSKILNSTKDHLGKESATRLNGYFMSLVITIMVAVTCFVECGNIYIAFDKGDYYSVGYGFVTIFGMILSHQLILFNLKRAGETTHSNIIEKMKDNKIHKSDNSGESSGYNGIEP